MKHLLIGLTSAALLFSQSAFAGHDNRYYDYGRVMKVVPVYHKSHGHHSNYNRDCYRDYNGHYSGYKAHNSLATVTGAVVGGVIGNKLGKGSKNRGVTTVAGAVVGGVIGHELSENHYSQERHYGHERHYKRRCEHTTHHNGHSRKLKGYEVTYRYKGERFTTFTREHPGRKIRLQVNLTPMYK